VLVAAVLGLLGAGLVAIHGASALDAWRHTGDPWFFVKRQAAFDAAGLAGMWLVAKLGTRFVERAGYAVLALAGVLMVLVLVPGVGQVAGHARRWFALGGVHVQPGEIAKVALCVYLARSVAEREREVGDFRDGFLPRTLVVGAFAWLFLLEPDFGSAVLVLALALGVLLLAGANASHFVATGFVAATMAGALVLASPERQERVVGLIDPFKHRMGAGFHAAASLTALASGGWFGAGLGNGFSKLGLLPAGHTDYAAAAFAEEMGVAGFLLVLLLQCLVIWRGVVIALRATDAFAAWLATATTLLLGLQAAVNVLVVTSLLPSRGQPLPFVSYGGSCVVASLACVGMLLAAAREAEAGADEEPDLPG